MIVLELKGSRSICKSHKSTLTIDYYLVQSTYEQQPVYGIQVHSHTGDARTSMYAEGIWNISYSLPYVNQLIDQCMEYYVTPTDLFSSIDLLMDKSM